jgi:hypothetical protein
MDLSAMQDLFALTGVGSAGSAADSVDDPSADAADSSSPVTRAELRQMHQQLLNAMQHQRKGSGNRHADRAGRPRGPPRVAGLSEQQVRERLDAGACFACGMPGHRKADCPTHQNGQKKSGN